MRLWIYSIITASAIVGFARTGIAASEPGSCKPFQVFSTGEGRSVAFLDAEPAGSSAGDVRIGRRKLIHADGSSAGEIRWQITPLDPGQGETPINLQKSYLILDDGTIMTEGLYEPQSPIEKTESVSILVVVGAVVGGTGKYRTARGTVTHTVGADGDPMKIVYDIDPEC